MFFSYIHIVIQKSVVWVKSLQDIFFLEWTSTTIHCFGVNRWVWTEFWPMVCWLMFCNLDFFWGWDGVAECWSDVGSSMAQVVFLTQTNSAGRAPELFAPWMPIGGYRVVGPRLIDGRGFWGVLGGADNVLGCPPYKIFSWTCCYAIHSSLARYPGTRYQLLLVTCKTLLIFALLFLGGGFGGVMGGGW